MRYISVSTLNLPYVRSPANTLPFLALRFARRRRFLVAAGSESSMAYYTVVTISAGRGYFTYPASFTDVIITGSSNNAVVGGETSIAITGLPSDITNLFQSGSLLFTPESNYNGADNLIFSVSTSINPGNVSTTAHTIFVTPVNDAPSITSPYISTSAAFSVKQGVSTTLRDVTLADPDSLDLTCSGEGMLTLTASLPVSSTSLLSISPTSAGGVEVTSGATALSGATSLTVRGTVEGLQSTVGTLSFLSLSDFVGAEVIIMSLDDEGNCGGSALSSSSTVFLNVYASNDPPTIASTMLTTIQGAGDTGNIFTTPEDSPITVPSIVLSDDGASSLLTVIVAADHGTVELSSQTDVLFASGSSVLGRSVTFSALQPDANSALSAVVYTPDVNFNDLAGPETLTVTVVDNGLNEVVERYRIAVTPVNDAPVLDAPSSLAVVEDIETILAGIEVSDPDDEPCGLTLTAIATRGSVQVDATVSVASGAVLSRDTGSISLTGSALAINSALKSLTYKTAQDDDANDDIVLTVIDQLCGASGLRVSVSVPVMVTSSFDAPYVVDSSSSYFTAISTPEDTPVSLSALIVNSPDTVGSSTVGFTVSSSLGGTITLGSEDGIEVRSCEERSEATSREGAFTG